MSCQQTATFEEKEETIRENRTHVVGFANRLAKLVHFGSGIHVGFYPGACMFICTHARYHFYGLVFTLVFIRVPVHLYTCKRSFLWSGIHVGVYPGACSSVNTQAFIPMVWDLVEQVLGIDLCF